LIIILAYKLRSKGSENFGFKSELKWVGLLTLLSVLIPVALAPIGSEHWGYWGGWVSAVLITLPSVLSPLRQSYKEEARSKVQEINLDNLRSILKSEQGFKTFLNFVTTEFSTENLFCWRELDEWIKRANDMIANEKDPKFFPNKDVQPITKITLYHQAREIYTHYMDEERATSLVNISSKLRQQIFHAIDVVGSNLSSFSDRKVTSLSPSISETSLEDSSPPASPTPVTDLPFDNLVETLKSIEKSLYDLMNHDSFLRFKNSKMFADLEAKTHTPPPQPYSLIESKVTIELGSNSYHAPPSPPDLLPQSIISSSAHEQDLLLMDQNNDAGTSQFDVQ